MYKAICVGKAPLTDEELSLLYCNIPKISVNGVFKVYPVKFDYIVYLDPDRLDFSTVTTEKVCTQEYNTDEKKKYDKNPYFLFDISNELNRKDILCRGGSGVAAVHCTIKLGFNNILLLGYDCKPFKDYDTDFGVCHIERSQQEINDYKSAITDLSKLANLYQYRDDSGFGLPVKNLKEFIYV